MIRLHNPGNIENDGDQWKGLSEDQPHHRFYKFISPEYGIRAIIRLLVTYNKKYDGDTIKEIITRWAPPSENNTIAYIKSVCKKTGKNPDDPVDITSRKEIASLVKAIILHENGVQPYDNTVIEKALDLAGIA